MPSAIIEKKYCDLNDREKYLNRFQFWLVVSVVTIIISFVFSVVDCFSFSPPFIYLAMVFCLISVILAIPGLLNVLHIKEELILGSITYYISFALKSIALIILVIEVYKHTNNSNYTIGVIKIFSLYFLFASAIVDIINYIFITWFWDKTYLS